MQVRLIALAMLVVSFSSNSIEIFEQEINSIGSQIGQVMYLYLKSDALKENQCKFEVVYCPIDKKECNAMLSIALTAKTTASKVYIAFERNSDNICNLVGIRL